MKSDHLIYPKTIEKLAEAILNEFPTNRIFIITDENVNQYCVDLLLPHLSQSKEIEIIEIEAGENSKSIEFVGHIYSQLIESNAGKTDVIVNIGGGVVCDLGGFIATTFKRGMPFINVPTSLLAMVDASIGGKTGIDHDGIKNVVGTIGRAKSIYILPEFLQTLPHTELKSGFAEMIKHAIISGGKNWNDINNIKEISVAQLKNKIKQSIQIKSGIVAKDRNESGERKILNFGHTIGHALESHFLNTDKPISHGECVAIGMIMETALAYQIGMIEENEVDQILNLINRFYTLHSYEFPEFKTIIPLMLHDKKNEQEQIKMSLPAAIGNIVFNVNAKTELIESTYEKIIRNFDIK